MKAHETLKKFAAESIGTAFLLAAVVGSGIMAEKLSAGNVSLALLENTLATRAALIALILCFGPISGGHFNPAVTLADATQQGIAWKLVPVYLSAQCLGALFGVYAAHFMFGQPVLQISEHVRSGSALLFSEFVATFGLLSVIWGCSRARRLRERIGTAHFSCHPSSFTIEAIGKSGITFLTSSPSIGCP